MQPRPSAETSRPCWPSVRFSRLIVLLLLLWNIWWRLPLKDVPRDSDGGHGPRPPGVERQVNDHFSELSLRQAVLLRPTEVAWKLLRVAGGDECSDSDEAAVARRELGTFPDIAKQDVVRELRQLGREIADQLLRARWFLWFRHLLSPVLLGALCDQNQ